METGKSTAVKKKKKKSQRFSPEREYIRGLMGNGVVLHSSSDDARHGPSYHGRLLWVDQYTVCIRLHAGKLDRMFWKHAIQSMHLDPASERNRGRPNDSHGKGSV